MTEAYDRPELRVDMAPFVGRAAELGRLDCVLERLGDSGPSVVDVTGEAGIGKSRLLVEFCERARRRGLTVLRGRATEYPARRVAGRAEGEYCRLLLDAGRGSPFSTTTWPGSRR
ncbi:ATP-binding protein [Embleya sp. NBC_00896]|uniref:ATP-binding protein n=1 Tax=Embleya sp. NBC_00896 TaxID=2975961 RepID=UPI002F90C7DE|nr:ATP-binding protein [Embleya sp. NBC_00896]